MTWWGAYELSGMAKGVGFTRDGIREATALAIVSSGGADHYYVAIEGAPLASQYGLFALTLPQLDVLGISEPFDPISAMEAAHQLWMDAGHSWEWSQSYSRDGGHQLRSTLALLDSQNAWRVRLGADHLGNVLPEWADSTLGL